MSSIDGTLLDFKTVDQLATGDTSIHRLGSSAKVLTTILFAISVVSFGKYEISALLPFFIFPLVIATFGNVPLKYLIKKITLLLPLICLVGIFNPFFDRNIAFQIGSFGISGGWLSLLSIIVRSLLTVSAALILIATTGLPAICKALERLGLPQQFTLQLHFLYRYIFVLTEEAAQMSRARELRCFAKKGRGINAYSSLIGHLLLKTLLRAERIHMAMLARGFDGEFKISSNRRFGTKEFYFITGWSIFFVTARFINLAELIGVWITG